jgi:hypothetical protein
MVHWHNKREANKSETGKHLKINGGTEPDSNSKKQAKIKQE